MAFDEELDRRANDLHDDPDATYETAIAVASAADRYTARTSSEAIAVAQLRDVFGTWVEIIHGPDLSHDAATAANGEISRALQEWSTKTLDLEAFAARWSSTLTVVDTAWLDDPGTRLVRRSRARAILDRLKRAGR